MKSAASTYVRTTDSFSPHLTPRGGRKDLALQDEAPRLRLASMRCLLLGPVRVHWCSLLRLPQGDPLGRQRPGPRLLAGPKDHRLRGGGVPGNQDQLLRLLLHEKLWYGAHVISHFQNSCFQDQKMKLTCSRAKCAIFFFVNRLLCVLAGGGRMPDVHLRQRSRQRICSHKSYISCSRYFLKL